MNRVLIAAIAATAVFATPVSAQSSKFAAKWEMDTVDLASAYEEMDGTTGEWVESGYEDTFAMIKSPQGKELLIGVSGVANLITFTEAKGKNDGITSTSMASAGLNMFVAYMPADEVVASVCDEGIKAAPGEVPLSYRKQTLSVTTDLEIVDVGTCDVIVEDDGNDYLDEGQCLADLLDIEGSVTVALGLETSAAHHFNFVAPDLERSTTYQVAACFSGEAAAEVLAGEGSANSAVAIGKRIVTIEEVRAVKDAFIDMN